MTEQTDKFILDKSVWTQDDYSEMGWHDSNIYGFIIEKSEEDYSSDLLLDIDYIFKWVKPVPPGQTFTFWISPCTLVFKNCFDLQIDLDANGYSLDSLEIADLYLKTKTEQENNVFVYEWTIELQQGKINLKSLGFDQIVRQNPLLVQGQVLSLLERGGINFRRNPI